MHYIALIFHDFPGPVVTLHFGIYAIFETLWFHKVVQQHL